MGLLGQPGQAPATAADPAAQSKKAEALAKFKASREAKKKAAFENALKLRDELVKNQLMDKLSAPVKEFILTLCKDPSVKVQRSAGTPSILSQIFGETPAVGQKATLQEIFEKTYKGESTIDFYVKRWQEKGIEIKKIPAPKKLDQVYEIVKLP